ncbi:methyltransferase [Bowmanella dokdonensis]|uniref:Ribosomal RNA large subunit methyltransferase G n=1 Tax=Bowmanella dokdonensis TaxID=751969 RepID=A0A939DPF2_9ALTE|nr:methyltransferase [Bowmanella dokdonensis]MBN7825531.1 methyltransferase [Bowmanella dokdonensis]
MNLILTLFDRSLKLQRYPARLQDKSQQAWDAADELIIEALEAQPQPCAAGKLLILNDDCGALTCWLSECRPVWSGDSHVSRLACEQNLVLNGLSPDDVTFCDSLILPVSTFDLVLIKIPKTLALLEHQLVLLQSRITPGTRIIAGAKVNQIQKSTLALFEKYLGLTHTSLARKKARLIHCTPTGKKDDASPYPSVWKLDGTQLNVHNHANVFARQQLDIGARFLLQYLPEAANKEVLDLGCGNGVLGLSLLDRSAPGKLVFVDESYMALASARLNVADNFPQHLQRCEFIASNCLEQVGSKDLDLILCNPPFHQQQRITDHIAWQMFVEARQALRRGGELRIVGNRHLGYHNKLKRLFGGCQQVAASNKFVILSAFKR